MAESYRDLIAWQKAKSLAVNVYRCTRRFPKDEIYGLSSQMRRASVSIVSNIAESKGRYSQKELLHFFYLSRGPLLELETQILIAHDLEYIDSKLLGALESETAEVGRILNGLIHHFTMSTQRVSSDPRPKTQDLFLVRPPQQRRATGKSRAY